MMYLKKMVNDPQIWESFLEYLDSRIKEKAHLTGTLECEVKLRKAQGAYGELLRLKSLKEEVNGWE